MFFFAFKEFLFKCFFLLPNDTLSIEENKNKNHLKVLSIIENMSNAITHLYASHTANLVLYVHYIV